MPCSPGMRRCRPLCAHRALVRDYHGERDRQLRAAESLAGGGWAARDDPGPPVITFKQWLTTHRAEVP